MPATTSITPIKNQMLCLHGFGQNANIFNQKLASFRSKIKNKFEFIIPQAPHLLPQTNTENTEELVYAWYYYCQQNPSQIQWDLMFDSITDINQLYGLAQSIKLIQNILIQNPNIQYIMGFSQGAGLLSLLCKLGIISDDKKLIFVSGFYPLKYDTLSEKFKHKSIHVFGELDTVISPQFSQQLAQFFSNSYIIKHNGRHVIPRISLTDLSNF